MCQIAKPSLAHLNTSYRHFFLFVNEVGSLRACILTALTIPPPISASVPSCPRAINPTCAVLQPLRSISAYPHDFYLAILSPFLSSPRLDSYIQFDLVDKKELAPLDELNDAILAEDKAR